MDARITIMKHNSQMNMLKFFSTHKVSILSVLLMAAAAVLGADGSFAMAVEIAGTESGGEVTPDV